MLKRWIKSLIGRPASPIRRAPARLNALRCEALEDRTVPAGNFATGAAFGESPIVRVFDGNTQQQVATIQVFDLGFKGGVNVAMGDVTGDGVADVVAGSALGFSHVKVFDGVTFQEIRSFMAFDGFAGGINVAAGDIDGDGKADIAVAVANQGGTHVKAFNGADGAVLASFFAYGQGFVGGVRVTLGDVDGDGKADIVTGAGPGSGGHVKVFDGATGAEFRSFLVFDGFAGSIDLAVGDLNGDGEAEVLVGAGPGAGPHVKAFDGATGELSSSFFAFAQQFLGGVSVGVDADGHIVVTGTGRSHVKTFDGVTGQELSSAFIAGSASGRIGTAPEPNRLVITSSPTVSAAEQQTAVTRVTTSGGRVSSLSYRITGGADAAKFVIDPTTGVLTFVAAPNFAEPSDAGTNNVYDVTVEASDGTRTATQAIAVTVTDVNNAPSGTSGTVYFDPDLGDTFSVGDFGFTDTDGGTFLAVKITTLPALGTLTLSGVPVTEGQFISAASLGSLAFVPASGAGYVAVYTTFTFQVQDNGGGTNLDPTPKTMTISTYVA